MATRVSGSGSVPVRGRFRVTAGCDVDKNFVVIGIFNIEATEITTREFSQDSISVQNALGWLLENNVELAIIESTAAYHMLYYDTFKQAGVNIHVINPLLIKSLLRVEGKSDKGDAATLARLASSFDLRVSNMPDAEQKRIRLHMRGLDFIKRERTRVLNRTNNTLTAAGITIYRLISLNSVSGLAICQGIVDGLTPEFNVDTNWRGRAARKGELVASLCVKTPAYLIDWLAEALDDIRRLNERIRKKEEALFSLIVDLGLTQQVAMMSTAPAISPPLALRIIGEMGQAYWNRYHSADAFAKAIGVVPANEVSGGKIVKRKTSHGNIHVKAHLLNSVKSWVLHAPEQQPLKQFYVNYRRRATYGKAISAVARQVVEALWHMGARGEAYRDKRTWVGQLTLPPPNDSLDVRA